MEEKTQKIKIPPIIGDMVVFWGIFGGKIRKANSSEFNILENEGIACSLVFPAKGELREK